MTRRSIIDLLEEAAQSLSSNRGRSVSTAIVTTVGVGAFIATLGLSNTASNQIGIKLDQLSARQISIAVAQEPPGSLRDQTLLPMDIENRLTQLSGVVNSGGIATVDIEDRLVSTSEFQTNGSSLTVIAATPGTFEAAGAGIHSGRVFDEGHSNRQDRVAVIGSLASEALGLANIKRQPAVLIGDESFTVIGTLKAGEGSPLVDAAIVIPFGTASGRFGTAGITEAIVAVDYGAASVVAQQVEYALLPTQPGQLTLTVPSDPLETRKAIESDSAALALIVAGVALFSGAVGIANSTLVSVMERKGEIGLRRALGASRSQIANQFLTEASLLGFAGATLGSALGLLVMLGVSIEKDWTPVLDPTVLLLAPLLGALSGLLAGVYPSWRAANLEPSDALRSGT